MALKTDREIASLKAAEGQRLVIAVTSGAGGVCVLRLVAVDVPKHGFIAIVSTIGLGNLH